MEIEEFSYLETAQLEKILKGIIVDRYKNDIVGLSQDEIFSIMKKTSDLIAKNEVNNLSSAVIAAQSSNALASNVEFWKWMQRNYSESGIFDSTSSMNQYIAQGMAKEEWVIKQLQGKGYEWDWMSAQRGSIKNVLNSYDAGDVANRAASDVTEYRLLSGNIKEYQMKAYTSKTNLHLENTPKDITIITNVEKVDGVQANGYENVESFQNNQIIKSNTNEKLQQIKSEKAYPSYNIKNVMGTMAKAGIIGCVIGFGLEAIASYRLWNSGQLSDEEYLKEILKGGGDIGATAGATAGIMIPVSAAITVAGISSLITIPIAFVVSSAVNKIVAPCFERGQYRQILLKAKYYQSIENIYDHLVKSMQKASEEYYDFVLGIGRQQIIHEEMKKQSMGMNSELKNLYDSI